MITVDTPVNTLDSLVHADSLAMVDSLAAVQHTMDSLSAVHVADSLRTVAEHEVFGVSSRIVTGMSEVMEQSVAAVNGWWYELFVMVALALYLIWLNRQVGLMQSHSKGSLYNSTKSRNESEGGYFGGHSLAYLLVAITLTLITCQLLMVQEWVMMVRIVVGWHVVFAATTVMLMGASYLSYYESIFEEVVALKIQYFVLSMSWMLPLSLILSLAVNAKVLSYIAVLQVIAILIGYIFTSFRLFSSKKISILNWILYLCTVEVLPTILLWTFLTRNISAI